MLYEVITCETGTDRSAGLLNFVPDDATILINGNSFENLSLAIDNNMLLIV